MVLYQNSSEILGLYLAKNIPHNSDRLIKKDIKLKDKIKNLINPFFSKFSSKSKMMIFYIEAIITTHLN